MQYVIIDPFLMCIPKPEYVSREQAMRYLQSLETWAEIIEKYDVKLRISSACRDALYKESLYPINEVRLSKLIQAHELGNTDDYFQVCQRLFNGLLGELAIDDEVGKSKNDKIEWEVDVKSVEITPATFSDRIEDEQLREAFKTMLAEVGFARNNKLLPISELKNVKFGTIFIEDHHKVSKKIEVQGRCTIVTSDILGYSDEWVQEAYEIAYDTKDFLHLHKISVEVRTTYEAVLEVGKMYPNNLSISDLALKTSRSYHSENPKDIFSYIEGLVLYWLPAYLSGGHIKADQQFYNKFSRRCAMDESETTKRKFSRDYTTTFEGNTYECYRHIKIGQGPNCARIYFDVITDSQGKSKILLGRVGRHGRTNQS
jgi:hypothetical protein